MEYKPTSDSESETDEIDEKDDDHFTSRIEQGIIMVRICAMANIFY